jgi:hypothetical protein
MLPFAVALLARCPGRAATAQSVQSEATGDHGSSRSVVDIPEYMDFKSTYKGDFAAYG